MRDERSFHEIPRIKFGIYNFQDDNKGEDYFVKLNLSAYLV